MLSRALLLLFTGWLALSSTASPLESNAKVVVLVFVSSECPISNKLAPEFERLHKKFSTNGVAFTLVYPNATDTPEKIETHRREYLLSAPFARDADHSLAKMARAKITPEAAVFDKDRNVVYRGRITDQFLALGKGRPQPSRHDLEEAIEAVVAGKKPKHAHLEAVGCFIQEP
jgi:thiol-disulfide isomerase/thioredoxin